MEIDSDNLQDWLEEPLDPPVAGHTTPREWLQSACEAALLSGVKVLPNDDWNLYGLCISMVPFFPDIVLNVEENGAKVEFAFDWKKVDLILRAVIHTL